MSTTSCLVHAASCDSLNMMVLLLIRFAYNSRALHSAVMSATVIYASCTNLAAFCICGWVVFFLLTLF